MVETSRRNVEYILLAEFNILTGSTIKHQFPYPTGVDEQMLAEFMLPDGAHKREDDWTVFFLNRPGQEGALGDSTKVDPTKVKAKKSKDKPFRHAFSAITKSKACVEGFVYRFDQQDPSSGWKLMGNGKKRVVLTDPIGIFEGERELLKITKTEFLEVTKMEELFIGVQDSENTAVGVRLSNANDASMFIKHVEEMKTQAQMIVKLTEKGIPPPNTPRPFLCCLNLVWNKLDSTVTRGAVVKSMAICTPYQFIDVFKPFIMLALDKYYKKQTIDVLSDLYFALNAADFSQIPTVSDFQRLVIKNHRKVKKKVADLTVLLTSDNPENKMPKMTIHVPLTTFPDEVGDFKVLTILQKFGRQTMTIFNAVLTGKRLLFLGFDCPAGEVCNYVLATVCMVCPPLSGVIHVAFPYTNLCYLDFLNVKGYIAGVSNPMFEEKSEWWDVLCNIHTGKITINQKTASGFPDPSFADSDDEFYNEAEFFVQSHFGEDKIRQLFQNYTRHIAAIAFGEEAFADDIIEGRENTRHQIRIAQWRQTLSYKQYERSRADVLMTSPLGATLTDVSVAIRALKMRKTIPNDTVLQIFNLLLQRVKTTPQIEQLLSFFPESEEGLYPIAIGLFHSSETVRSAAFEVLKRMGQTELGAAAIAGMDYYLAVAYHRINDQPTRAIKEKSRREMLSMRAAQPSKL